MCHLVENATRLVVVVSRALRRKLGEVPEAVVGARHNNVVRWDGVQQCIAAGAVTVRVDTRDLGRRGLHVGHVVVDRPDLGLVGGRYEPGKGSGSAGAILGGRRNLETTYQVVK